MKTRALCFFGALVFAQILAAQSNSSGPPVTVPSANLAPTPPMGWNSWDSYGRTITEAQFKANALWMAKHLKRFGWEYAVIDEGWYIPDPAIDARDYN
ncbi:MAG: hypothetical protein WBE31_09820, partial [Candidatus Sulfotelmatobacter sp.]